MNSIAQPLTPRPLNGATSQTESAASRVLGFMIQHDFDMQGLDAALKLLRRANQLAEAELYRWQLISPDGLAVTAANGLDVHPQQAAERLQPQQFDMLVVCATDSQTPADPRLLDCLARCREQTLQLGGIGNGSLLLAQTGLLDGFHCATHWDLLPGLRQQFPQIEIEASNVVIDRDRFSCADGSSVAELMLTLIERHHGPQLRFALTEAPSGQMEAGSSASSSSPQQHWQHIQPRLADAIALMEANLEEPISQTELAGYVGISSRQLERLFQKFLGCSPTRYYLKLRMGQARQLLIRTNKPITEVAAASGFISSTHFSRRYRELFGISPRETRKRNHLSQSFSVDLTATATQSP